MTRNDLAISTSPAFAVGRDYAGDLNAHYADVRRRLDSGVMLPPGWTAERIVGVFVLVALAAEMAAQDSRQSRAGAIEAAWLFEKRWPDWQDRLHAASQRLRVRIGSVMLSHEFFAIRMRAPAGAVTATQHTVASEFGMTRARMLAKGRRAEVVQARHMAIWIVNRLSRMSLPEVGRLFGGRDHTTILHTLRKCERLQATDEVFAAHAALLTQRCSEFFRRALSDSAPDVSP